MSEFSELGARLSLELGEITECNLNTAELIKQVQEVLKDRANLSTREMVVKDEFGLHYGPMTGVFFEKPQDEKDANSYDIGFVLTQPGEDGSMELYATNRGNTALRVATVLPSNNGVYCDMLVLEDGSVVVTDKSSEKPLENGLVTRTDVIDGLRALVDEDTLAVQQLRDRFPDNPSLTLTEGGLATKCYDSYMGRATYSIERKVLTEKSVIDTLLGSNLRDGTEIPNIDFSKNLNRRTKYIYNRVKERTAEAIAGGITIQDVIGRKLPYSKNPQIQQMYARYLEEQIRKTNPIADELSSAIDRATNVMDLESIFTQEFGPYHRDYEELVKRVGAIAGKGVRTVTVEDERVGNTSADVEYLVQATYEGVHGSCTLVVEGRTLAINPDAVMQIYPGIAVNMHGEQTDPTIECQSQREALLKLLGRVTSLET